MHFEQREACCTSRRRESLRAGKTGSATRAALNNKIKAPYSFAHSLPAEEEERERSIFLWLSRIRRMRVNQNPDFPGSARHVILTVKGAAENRSLFAVGGPGASERGVKKNHDLIRNLKS